MRQTSSLLQTQLLPVSGMSHVHRGEKRKLQVKKGGGRQIGRGHSSFCRMTRLFYYLSLPSTSTHRSQSVHSTPSIYTTVTHDCALSSPLFLGTSLLRPRRKKTGESNISSSRLSAILQCSLAESLPVHPQHSFSSTGLSDVPGPSLE